MGVNKVDRIKENAAWFKAVRDRIRPSAWVRRWIEQVPLHNKVAVLLFTLVCGAGASLGAVAFLWLTQELFHLSYERLASASLPLFLGGTLALVLGSSLLVGYLLHRFSPEAAGSGIPELKVSYWKDLGHMPFRPVAVKFVASVLSLAGGASLGREGPTVFIGGGLASSIARWLRVPKQKRRTAALVGSAAGLAAAFNTPLAAIVFVLEEVLGDFGSRALGSVVLAAVIGAFTIHGLIGPQPAFLLPEIGVISSCTYLLVPLVAALAALLGVTFQSVTLRWRARIRQHSRVPVWLRPACGGLATWFLGCAMFLLTGRLGIFSLGYGDLSAALSHDLAWQVAGLLIVPKLLATIASYSWGGCGGIFSPTLFLGGMTGIFVGGLSASWLPLGTEDQIVLATVGMSACLAAVVRAPLTCLLIVFEMTHQFALVPALMIGLVLSQIIGRLAGHLNLYDALLLQNGHELLKIKPPPNLQAWQDLPVSAVANPRPVALRATDAPALREALSAHPYRCFPTWTADGALAVLTRREILAALAEGRPPRPEKATLCHADETIRQAADRLVQASSGILLAVHRETGDLCGLLTLHDLLRAQAAVTE